MPELPSWFGDAGERRTRNARSRRQERERARQVGGRTTPGSGSSPRSPGDVRAEDYLEELKYTDKKSFSLKVEEWIKHRRDALRLGREPRMVVDFSEYGVRLIITEEEL